jgi:hypothetical protein
LIFLICSFKKLKLHVRKQGVIAMIHPEMPQHCILALDHHKRLLEEAERQRLCAAAERPVATRPHRLRGLRLRVGDLLISMGQRLKADAVWG